MNSQNQDFRTLCAVATDIGHKKDQNEDFIAYYEPRTFEELQESGRLYIVADGVGGAVAGEKASEYAALRVKYDYYRNPHESVGDRLRQAVQTAGNEIFDFIEGSGRYAQMATTMVAAVIRNGELTVANVGDSRAYLIRQGRVIMFTHDHTVPGERFRHGDIDEEEMQASKGALTRSVGGEPDTYVDIYEEIPPLEPGDRLLLCTDGLARYTLQEEIVRLVASGDPRNVVGQCIKYANRAGGADNISVLLVEIGEMTANPFPAARAGDLPPGPVGPDLLKTKPNPDRAPGVTGSLHRNRSAWVPGVVAGAVLVLVALVAGFAALGGGNLSSALTQPSSPTVAAEVTQAEVGVGVTESAAPPVVVVPTVATEEHPGPRGNCQVAVRLGQETPIRQGPGLQYYPVPNDSLKSSEHVTVLARYGDPPWWQISKTGSLDSRGWISAGVRVSDTEYRLTILYGDCQFLPTVTPDPNLPTRPAPTNAPNGTATATQEPTEVVTAPPTAPATAPAVTTETAPPSPLTSGCVYQVQKDDTLTSIAAKFKLNPVPEIFDQFKLISPGTGVTQSQIFGNLMDFDHDNLTPGTYLKVPVADKSKCPSAKGGDWKEVIPCTPDTCPS